MWLRILALATGVVAASATASTAIELRLWVSVPAETPADAMVRMQLTGEYNIPFGDDENFANDQILEKQSDGRYTTTVELRDAARLAFRFTRGEARALECGPRGRPAAMRQLHVEVSRELELRVAQWCDLGPSRTIGATVSEHHLDEFLERRRFWVYLPPSYENGSRDYPVLYMLDGQNLFDDTTSFVGEWHVDEICDQLIAAGEMEELIVVGIDNGGVQRVDEYTPWSDGGTARGGGGQEHLREIIDGLMPWVEQSYRVRGGPNSTGFAGSSLGGLMALYAARERSGIFGRVAALSPSLWWSGGRILGGWSRPARDYPRLWVDMGSREGHRATPSGMVEVSDAITDLRGLRAQLVETGYIDSDRLRVVEVEGGEHNEAAWSARLPEILRYLFPAPDGRPTPDSRGQR
jgi:predicted alpha/beta superfamily hydrolase